MRGAFLLLVCVLAGIIEDAHGAKIKMFFYPKAVVANDATLTQSWNEKMTSAKMYMAPGSWEATHLARVSFPKTGETVDMLVNNGQLKNSMGQDMWSSELSHLGISEVWEIRGNPKDYSQLPQGHQQYKGPHNENNIEHSPGVTTEPDGNGGTQNVYRVYYTAKKYNNWGAGHFSEGDLEQYMVDYDGSGKLARTRMTARFMGGSAVTAGFSGITDFDMQFIPPILPHAPPPIPQATTSHHSEATETTTHQSMPFVESTPEVSTTTSSRSSTNEEEEEVEHKPKRRREETAAQASAPGPTKKSSKPPVTNALQRAKQREMMIKAMNNGPK